VFPGADTFTHFSAQHFPVLKQTCSITVENPVLQPGVTFPRCLLYGQYQTASNGEGKMLLHFLP